jgi:hypothetical protein
MVVGFDVHHGGGKTTGAMVATMTSTLATYFSTMTEHQDRMEVSSGVAVSFSSKNKYLFLCSGFAQAFDMILIFL